jgi:hypothetical protein
VATVVQSVFIYFRGGLTTTIAKKVAIANSAQYKVQVSMVFVLSKKIK